jgi:DNA-binding NtrC family response regulator
LKVSAKILIVDDDSLVLRALKLTFQSDYQVSLAASGQEALDILNSMSDIEAIVLDIKMAPMDGLETARKIREINKDIPIIFHTGYPGNFSEEEIEKSYNAFDYVTKEERPIRLIRAVKQAVSRYRLKFCSYDLIKLARNQYGMVGKSQAMQNVYRIIEKIASTDNKIMILGATGTGKELVARAIHKRSRRAGKRLAILNCNHKQPDLVESELFGHIRGAFTGAVEDRVGLFEYADKGTLFLDEIGDLDITTQAKLLRALETGEVQRIGSPEVRKTNVRLICATNRDLRKMVSNKKFREDLYYRLKGITISLPDLKDRKEDIPLLLESFSNNYCLQHNVGVRLFDSYAIDLMIDYEWPGNVRQLLDTVQSLIDLSSSSYITREEVAEYLEYPEHEGSSNQSLNTQLTEYKKSIIIKALTHNNGNVSATARELSVDPANLHRMIKALGIENV